MAGFNVPPDQTPQTVGMIGHLFDWDMRVSLRASDLLRFLTGNIWDAVKVGVVGVDHL